MTEIHRLSPDYAAASHEVDADWAAVAAAGFRSVVNHRPDHEDGPRQPSAAEIGERVRAHGLAYAHQPVADLGFGADEVQALRELLATLPGPVLAFCRSGRRSTRLYEAVLNGLPPPEPEPEVVWLA